MLGLSITTSALAQANLVQLDGPKSSEDLQPHISYYLDDNWERTIPDILGEYANQFTPIKTQDPDFGYTKAKIWLRIDFENQTQLTEDWRLYFRENFKQLFDVYVVRENFSVENVLSQDLERGFQSRPIQFPELVAPILIEPGAKVTVLVSYWSEGASYVRLSMETATTFADIASKRTARNFTYYGMTMLLIVASLIAFAVYRRAVFPAYIAYTGSTLLFLMHSDGVAYQYLWPGFPKFNSSASILVGSAIILSACTYARVFLSTKRRHPVIDKMLLAVIATTLALDVAALFVDNQPIKKYLVFMSLVTGVVCTLSGIVAARTRFKEVRFYLLAWLGIFFAALIMNLRHLLGLELTQDFQYNFMRIVMVVDAAMMGLAISDRYNQLRIARQAALRESLEVAERNLELSRRLSFLETNFSEASKIVESKDKEIAHTIHDLKQPLHALRLRVHELMEGNSPSSDSGDIDETFTYLEDLVKGHLNSETSPLVDQVEKDLSPGDLTTHDVLKSVHEMFLPDASKKGLEFRYVETSLNANIPSLSLMRLVTNLVSNAIKYTPSGKVLLGCRRTDAGMTVEVHDTGSGLSPKEFEEALNHRNRLEGAKEVAEGNGIGLSIVEELCKKHGLSLRLCERRKAGSGIILELPISEVTA